MSMKTEWIKKIKRRIYEEDRVNKKLVKNMNKRFSEDER